MTRSRTFGRGSWRESLPIGMLAGLLATAPARAQLLPAPMTMQAPVPPMPDAAPQPRSLPVLDESAAADEAALLGVRMRLALGAARVWTAPPTTARALALGQTMLLRSGRRIDRPQLLLLADRASAVQRLWVVLAMPEDERWSAVGAVRISSGKPGKLEHFKTPVGVFDNDAAILGYRAQGTFNENHIRGNGVAGMRVWDFGWQTTEDWRKQGALTAVRLEMHATDPTFLENRLGHPDSEACIRIPAVFNQFMDQVGLIDARLLALVPQDRAITALLPKNRAPTPLAGELVIVVDSSDPAAAPSDPVEAEAINQRFSDWLAAQAATLATQQILPQQTGKTVAPDRTADEGQTRPSTGPAVVATPARPSDYAIPVTKRIPVPEATPRLRMAPKPGPDLAAQAVGAPPADASTSTASR